MSEIALLFTSNSRPLYRRDILNVCTEPETSHITFGYRPDWIHNYKKRRIAKNLDALIIFTEKQSPPESGPFAERGNSGLPTKAGVSKDVFFYPLRLAKIHFVEIVDGSYLINLELGRFFNPRRWSENGNFLRFQDYLRKIPGNPATEDRKNRKFVLINECTWFANNLIFPKQSVPAKGVDLQFTSECLPLIEASRELPAFDGCSFLCVQSSTSLRANSSIGDGLERSGIDRPFLPKFCFPDRELEGTRNSFNLRVGETYSVKILVISNHRSPEDNVPKLSIEEKLSTVSVLGPFVKQSPLGYQVEFLVRCKHNLSDEWGGFFVRVEHESETYKSSEISGIIKIQRAEWAIRLIVALIPFSVILSTISPDVIRDFYGSSTNSWLCENVVCIPASAFTVSVMAKAVGFGFSLMAAWLLGNRLTHK